MEFIDEHWNAYPDQWEVLLGKKKLSKEFIEDKIKEWKIFASNKAVEINEIWGQDGEKPWDRTKDFWKGDVNGDLQITLADGVYILRENSTDSLSFFAYG